MTGTLCSYLTECPDISVLEQLEQLASLPPLSNV